MKKIVFLLGCVLHLSLISYAQQLPQGTMNQTNARIAGIENKLQLLHVDVPGLTEKVNINLSSTSLANFLKAISQVHKINISVSQELSGISIVNGFSDVTVHDLLLFVAKEYELDIMITGTILSIKKYTPPVIAPTEKEIQVSYDALSNTLSTDISNDPLPKVFRKITEVSGKNLLYAPELSSKNLNLFISKVPIDVALRKLAEANQLEFSQTKDGFYEFEGVYNAENGSGTSGFSRSRHYRNNERYQILDTVRKMVRVHLENTPISEVILPLAEDLKLDIYIASPLESAGNVTLKTEAISFDELLLKIFQQGSAVDTPLISNNSTSGSSYAQNNTNSGANTGRSTTATKEYTFKKEGNIYYFGTEDQLAIRKIEMVQMMHRSIAMLGDPSPAAGFNSGSLRSSNFVSGGTNYIGGNSGNSGFQNTRNTNSYNSRTSSAGTASQVGNIHSLFPQSVTRGLDIKVDTELNSFIVSGPGARIENFKKFVTYIDKPVPLILIEVMILEVSRSATIETGVEFGIGKEPVATEGVSFPDANITLGAKTINRIIGGFDGFGSLNLGNVVPNFYMDIKAMETNGNLKILSTPKLSTLNGHKAYLSSGQTTYYAVTNQNFFGSQIPQTSQVVNYQPIDAELALEFKPFVSGDGQITLDIQVIQSNFSGERIAEDAPPDINSRRFSSIMRMRTNDVAILGGIERKIKNNSGSGVPFLSKIPIIKWFFSKRKREDSKRKLNVIIKPTVFY
ncbi:type II and III secretion system protein [Aquimarina sp. TRL1]|uniref:type II secretion system protein GspD n=1 Tax=Aquimarina sp. (strain TRL1) TaxID=2736252 RepID=UPI00158B9A6D|nr:type II and III secretion system protein [Aquimarina sp. TRL1]QKX03546.1 type II and III secretion system protein [Aquimarina sp. TRL1]